MATSLVAQLQRLAVPDTEQRKRPFTRPSILFDPKEAADIELDTILNIALSGLEVLISIEERFKKYKNDLFSYGSRELDRELMGIEENNRINSSIYSYLQLLSGYFELSAALKTLEYLIRRYKIHIYNVEELILCALPYHDTHVFVRVVQLIDTGNSKWKFLEGVKASGAPLPRKIIVQQSIRDFGILDVLCNYVTTSKKVEPSRPVTGFCTAVVFEVLGSLTTIDSEAVRRVLPFVEFGLQSGSRGGTDQKAGALMIVSLLADKVALSPKVVKSLIRSLAEVARADARDSTDLQWCRMSLMTLITLVQLQSVEIIPKKIIDILKDIRNISGLLSELVEEFNTEKFLALFLDSLVEYSCSDDLCHGTLLSIVDMVPLKDFVARIVSKLLNTSLRILKDNDSAGSRCNHILVSLLKKYLFESREAVNRYIEDLKLRSKNDYEIVIRMLNCNLDLSHEISNSKVWFAMEHPKAEVRRSALLGLDVRGMLNVEAVDSQRFGTIQDAILRRLCDEDLTVVQAALNLEALPEIINAPFRIDAFRNVLSRCIKLLSSGASRGASLAVDIALSCLQHAAAGLPDEGEHVKMVAALIFPFIIIIPKTQRLNLKALEMAKQMKWPFYENLVSVSLLDKKLDSGKIASINAENINVLAKALSIHPEEHLPWLVECCKTLELSKTLFLLVLLQSFTLLDTGDGQFSTFFGICFPILRMEWELLESAGNISEEFNPGLCEGDINILIEHMVATNPKELNGEILTCLFWRLLGSFSKIAAETEPSDKNENWLCCFRDLFVFLVSRTNHVFRKHLCNVVAKCKIQTSHFLSEFFTDEGVSAALLIGSLQVFTSRCARPDESLIFQLFAEFPSILVPLSSDNQDVRTAAMNTIEGLLSLWSRVNLSRYKNGPHAVRVHFLGELLGLMVQQKRLLISDKNVLASLFSSLLGNSNDSLLVQPNVGKRFDRTTKDEILAFLIESALRFSAYAKLKILSLLKGVGHTVLRVNGIEPLMLNLLDRRQKCHIGFDKSCHKLSQVEVTILCLLLELCIKPSTSTVGDLEVLDPVLKALQVSAVSSGDPAILKPCMTVLGNLSNSFYASLKTETQDLVFRHLVLLFRSTNGDIQKATREALLRINITCSIVSRILEFICDQKVCSTGSRHEKKRKKGSACNSRDVCLGIIPGGGNIVAFVGSLLDVLLLKKDMKNRASLICPLFKLLQNAFIDNEWIHVAANQDDLHYHASSENSQIIADAAVHIQQELLLILEDITASVTSEDKSSMNFDVELLIKCARSSSNMVTRNQIFSLLSAISRTKPDDVLDHILEILVIIGESAVTQWDSNFQHIFEDLISAVVPCWLSKTNSADALLQIFVSILPQVSEHRRISMIVHVLRHLGESVSLGSLLYLLFRSLVARNCSSLCDRSDPSFSYSISLINTQWEYLFAADLLEKYSCTVWLPSILMLLQRIVVSDSDATLFMEQLVAMHFISNKLQDPEIAFKLDSGEDLDNIQLTVGLIMKEIVCHLQLVDSKRKQIGVLSVFRRELKEYINTVLSAVTKRLTPSVYFKAIVQLLGHVDKCVRRKALGTLSETVKDTGFVGLKHEKRGPALSSRSSWFHLDENSLQSLDTLCLEILKLVNSQSESSSSLKLAAVSTLEVLANRFPSDNAVFSVCLDSVSKSICMDNSALSSSCLRTAGALINVLGPKALPQLPFVMEGMIRQSRNALSTVTAETKQTDGDASIVSSIQNDSGFMSILLALEAVVDKLGGFLNPYLGDILELMLLKPQYTSTSELKLKLKAGLFLHVKRFVVLRDMREIVTIQVGNYANFIGSHFWNFQDELLGLAESHESDQVFKNHGLDMDVLYRTGETLQGLLTYTPRMVSVNFQGSLGSVSSRGSLYNQIPAKNMDVMTWKGRVTTHASEPLRRNLFLQSLSEEEQESAGKANALDNMNNNSPAEIQDNDIVECLESDVQYWTDFSKVHYHPQSLYELSGLWLDIQDFDNYGLGKEAFCGHQHGEEIDDRLRFFVEECDHIQGIQCVVDDSGGFSGVSAMFLESIADEYPNVPVLLYNARNPSLHMDSKGRKQAISHNLHDAVSFSRLSELCKLIIPAGLPSLSGSRASQFLCIKDEKPYHSSAVYASAMHSFSLPFRMKQSGPSAESICTSGALDMYGTVQMLAGQMRQNMVTILDVAMPAPSLSDWARQSFLGNLQPLIPYIAEDVEDFHAVETMNIHGAVKSGNQRASINEVKDAVEAAYDNSVTRPKFSHLSTSTCPLPIPLPFPSIFGNMVGQHGELLETPISGSSSRGSLEVHSIPMATRLRSSTAVLPFLESKLGNLRRFGLERGALGAPLLQSWGFGKDEVEDMGEVLSKLVTTLKPYPQYSSDSD